MAVVILVRAVRALALLSTPLPSMPRPAGIHLIARAAQIDGHFGVRLRVAAADVDVQARVEAAAGGAGRQSDVRRLTVDFRQQAGELGVQSGAVAAEGVGGGLCGQRLEPVQNIRNVIEAAIDDLQNAGTVIGVPNALL